MPARKKPAGAEWQDFVDKWDNVDHKGKLELANQYSASYDLAKHWISEGDTTNIQPYEETEEIRQAIDEILDTRPHVALDFVSFDIETSNLTADFSVLLSAVIKPFGRDAMVFRADDYPSWETGKANDKELCVDIIEELSKHAIVVTHYGHKFDMPYMKAKMVKHGLPQLPPMFGVDTLQIARANFKVSSRRLENLGRYFELGQKSRVEGGLWMDAAYNGNRAAMDAIVAHNIQDVILLERLTCITFPYIRSIRRL